MCKYKSFALGVLVAMLCVLQASAQISVSIPQPKENRWAGSPVLDDGSTQTITILTSINGLSAGQITRAEFYYNTSSDSFLGGATLIGTVTSEPFQIEWNSRTAVATHDSSVWLQVRVFHTAGGTNPLLTNTHMIQVDNEIPQRPPVPTIASTVNSRLAAVSWSPANGLDGAVGETDGADIAGISGHRIVVNNSPTASLSREITNSSLSSLLFLSGDPSQDFHVHIRTGDSNRNTNGKNWSRTFSYGPIKLDEAPPTCTITPDAVSVPSSPITFTITCADNESLVCTRDFLTEGELQVTNGSIVGGSLSTADNITYTVQVTPNANTDVTLTVPAGAFQDCAGGNSMGCSATVRFDDTLPTITNGTLAGDNTYIDVSISEAVYADTGVTGALQLADLNLNFLQNAGQATNVTMTGVTRPDGSALQGGETSIRVLIQVFGFPDGQETVEITPANGNTVFDAADNAMASTETTGPLNLNPVPNVSVSVDVSSASEAGASTVTYTYTLSKTWASTVTIESNFTGSASFTDDFVDVTGADNYDIGGSIPRAVTITFTPGQTSRTLQVRVVNDNLVESSELLTATLQNGIGINVDPNPANQSATHTILDDETANVFVEFTTASANVSEDGGAQNVGVRLNTSGALLGSPITVDVIDAGGGTASSNTDYSPIGTQSLTFPANSTDGAIQNATITPTADTLVEGGESVNLRLQNLAGPASLGSQSNHTATITDAESATVAFQTSTSSLAEATANQSITVVLNTGGATLAVPVTVEVNDQVNGSATRTGDYNSTISQTLNFAVGSVNNATENAQIQVLTDDLAEGDETVNLRLENANNALLANPTNHTVTITDDDDDTVTLDFVGTSSNVGEGNAAHNVFLQLNTGAGVTLGSQVTVRVANLLTGNAIRTQDYNTTTPQTLTFTAGAGNGAQVPYVVNVLQDTLIEGDETVDLRASNVSGPQAGLGAQTNHTATITDDDDDNVTVSFSATTSSTPEADANHNVAIQLNAPAGLTLANPVTVAVGVTGGSAASPGDYDATFPQTLTFSPGDGNGATENAVVGVNNDSSIEGNETIDLRLSAITGPQAGLDGPTNHTVTIQDDDDDAVTVAFVQATSTVSEADTNHNLTVRLTTPAGTTLAGSVTVQVASVGGSATSGADYDNTFPLILTFPASAGNGATQNAVVGINSDLFVENDETANFRLGGIIGPANLGAQTNHSTTITDDGDISGVSIAFSLATSAVGEANANHPVNVTLTAPAGHTLANPITVNVSNVGGSASAGNDYTAINSTLTFNVGAATGSNQDAQLPILNDNFVEGDETVDLELSAPTGPQSGLGAQTTHEVTIQDEDDDTVSLVFAIPASNTPEADANHNVGVRIVMGAGLSLANPVIVDVSVVGGSASSPADYDTSFPQTLTFPATSASGATQNAVVGVNDDTLIESDETIDLRISNPVGPQAGLGPDTNHQVTIIDGGDRTGVTVSFALANSAREEADTTHVVNAILTAPGGFTLANSVVVQVTDLGTGSATANGTDYSFSPQTLTFPVGAANGNLQGADVEIDEDLLSEGDETINLRLGGLVGPAALANPTNHTATITDEDTPRVSFVTGASSTAEDGGGNNVVVQLTAPVGVTLAAPIIVDVVDLITGSATSTTDYTAIGTAAITFGIGAANGATQSVAVTPVDDTLVEGDETLDLQLQNLQGQALFGAITNHTATITDEDDDSVTVSFQAATSSVGEANVGHGVNAVLITPAGHTLANPVTVTITDVGSGSALSDTDYTFTSQVLTFAIGDGNGAVQTANSAILNDSLIEGDEDFDLRMGSIMGPSALGAATNHEVTITDEDDDAVTVSFQIANSAVGEANATHGVNAILNAPGGLTLANAVSVTVTDVGSGNALSGTDYTFAPQVLVFPVGVGNGNTQAADVTITADTLIEGDETIDLRVGSLTGPAALANPTNHQVTITDDDDDSVTVSFQLANSAVAETAGAHAVNAVLNAPAGLTLASQVTVTVSDLATGSALGSGTDYTFNTQILTFGAGAGNGATELANSAIVDDMLVEGDEDFDLRLSALTGPVSLAGPTNHEVTINDEDDDAVTVSFQLANSAVGEANSPHLVNAVLNVPVGHSLAVAVTVAVADLGTGNALSGTDYTAFPGVILTFPVGAGPGSTEAASLGIRDDNLIEGDEAIDLQISGLTGPATLANPTNHTVTITDEDDDNVTVTFQLANSAVFEANTTHLVNVILNAPAGVSLASAVSVNVSDLQNGTATPNGTDYAAATPQTLVFPAGAGGGTTRQATLNIFEDVLSEGNEVVNLQLDTLTGPVALANPTNHPVTILDDDAPLVLFQLAGSSVNETAGNQTVNVLLQTPAGVTLGVPVTVEVSDALTGTALSGTDYAAFSATTVTFSAGSGNGTTRQVTLTGIVDDNLVEGAETVHLDLGNLTGPAILSAPSLHAVTIIDDDDDAVTVSFVAGTSTIGEANIQHPVIAVLNLPGGLTLAIDVTVDVVDAVTGSAISATDYTIFSPQSLTFTTGSVDGATAQAVMQIIDDNFVESPETIDLQLANLAGPALIGNPSNHEVTIDDDEDDFVSVTFASANSAVGEANVSHDVVVRLITPVGVTLAAPVMVDVSDLATGSAANGTDYTAVSPQTVTFSVGDTTGATRAVRVDIIDDTLIEGDETVNLQLVDLVGPAAIANPSNHTVTITDEDDDFVTVTFLNTTSSVGEANTTHNVAIVLTAAPGLTLAVAVSVDVGDIASGTAAAGTDYTADPQTVTFLAGAANGATELSPITIIDDLLVEGDETVNLMLSSLVGPAGIFIPSTHQVTITDDDDDAVTVSVQVADSAVGEATVSHSFNAILNAPANVTLAAPVTVNVSDVGTGNAASASDYSAYVLETLTFGVGATNGATQATSVDILDDSLIENSETVDFQVSGVGGPASLGALTVHVVTITDDDDDAVRVVFSAANSAVTENNTIQNVNVQLVTPAGFALAAAIVVEVSDLVSGTALSGGTDYSATTPQSLTFAVGSGNGTVVPARVTIVEDILIEGDETANLQLGNLVGPGSLGALTNHTLTITDDDDDTVNVDFRVANSAIGEANATQNVIVVFNAPATFVLAVDVTVDVDDLRNGAAAVTLDYNAADPQPVTFSAGAMNGATAVVSVQVLDDLLVEGDEAVNLRLTNLIGPANIGLPSNHTVTIADEDDDNVTVSLQSIASTVAEINIQHNVHAVLSAPGLVLAVPITVNVSVVGGTATGNADYTATSPQILTFSAGAGNGDTESASYVILPDNLIEGDETINLLLNTLAGPGSLTNPTTHVVTITDEDDDNITVEFANSATNVAEASAPHTVPLVLNAPAGLTVGNPISVTVQDLQTGSAGPPGDYITFANPQSVIFGAGVGNGGISSAFLLIRDDNLVEGDETINLEIQAISGPAAIGLRTTHQVTILDDDDNNVFVEFQPTTSMANESNISHSVTAVLVAPGLTLTQPLQVDIIDRGTGTAAAGSDYSVPAQTLTFPAGSADGATEFGSVNILDDSVPEGNETIHLALSNVVGPGGLNNNTIHVVTIIPDNDSGPQCVDDAFTVLEGGTFTTFAGDAACIEFDGLDSSFLLTNNVPAWNSLNSITIAFRMRWDGYVAGDALFMRTQENPTLFSINSNSQRIRFTVYNGVGGSGVTGSDFIETGQGLFDGELRQFVFRWDNFTQTGQIWHSIGDNMVLVAEDTGWTPATMIAPNRPLMLGRNFLGCMDEIAIYSSYEDPNQFFDNGIYMAPPTNGSLLFHTNGNAVNAGAGTVDDLSGNGNDMTLIGNPQPVQYSQTFTIAPGASTVLANDWDPDPFDFLTASLVTGNGQPANGAVTSFEGNGSLVYVHDGSETASDWFTYRTTDLAGQTCTATVFVTVIPIFDKQPICSNDAFTVAEGGTIDTNAGGVMTNPPGGTSVLENETDADASDVLSATVITGPVNGTLTLNTNGTFIYTHDGTSTTIDSFTYRVTDLGGFTCTARTNITISTTCDEAPICAGESYTVAEGGSLTGVNLLANETDGDLPNDLLTVVATSGPSNGTITLTSLGAFTYNHDGTDTVSDSISYRVTDTCGHTCDATVTITVINVCDQPPSCTGESITVNEGATFTGLNLLDNETDGDLPNDVLTVSLVSGVTNGSLTLASAGSFTYTHNDSETPSDSFRYRVTDTCGQTCEATVTVTVTPVCDQPPNCSNIAGSLTQGGTVFGNVLNSVTDADLPNDVLTVSVAPVSGPSFGTVNLTAGGTFTYTHDNSNNLIDSFVYRVIDSCGQTCTATVNLTVIAMHVIQPNGPTSPVRENHWVPIDITLETPALQAFMFAIDYNPGAARSLTCNYRVERVGTAVNSNARITVAEDDNDQTGTLPTRLWVGIDGNSGGASNPPDLGDAAISAVNSPEVVLRIWLRVEIGAPIGDATPTINPATIRAWDGSGSNISSSFSAPAAVTPVTIDTNLNPLDVDETGIVDTTDASLLYRASLWGNLRGLVEMLPSAQRAADLPVRATDSEIIANYQALISDQMGVSLNFDGIGGVGPTTDLTYLFRRLLAQTAGLPASFTVPAGHTADTNSLNTSIDGANAEIADNIDPIFGFSNPDDNSGLFVALMPNGTIELRYNESLRSASTNLLTAATVGSAVQSVTDSVGPVTVALGVQDDARTITLTPNADMWSSGTVTIVINRAALFDVQGNQGSGTDTIIITAP